MPMASHGAKNIIANCFLGILSCHNAIKSIRKSKEQGRKLLLLTLFFSKVLTYSRFRLSRKISMPVLEMAI